MEQRLGQVGAAILIDGSAAYSGAISAGNALIGMTVGDGVGQNGVSVLSDGNYLVSSFKWNGNIGAVTWVNGITGALGPVSPSNSLTGSGSGDHLGNGGNQLVLANGNYVVFDSEWSNGVSGSGYGAATWCRAGGSCTGPVSTARSFYGATQGDGVGNYGAAFSDGNYVIASPFWTSGGTQVAGAMTLGNGRFRLKGTIQPWNSVMGTVTNGGDRMTLSYDVARHRLAVGRPAENIVSLFTMDQIFADDFDP
jgi:Repeat of unknown function (DUF5650)